MGDTWRRVTIKETSRDNSMLPRESRQGDGDKQRVETSVTRRETQVGRQAGDKCKVIGQVHPEQSSQEYPSKETSRETRGDKCKNIRPSVARVCRENITEERNPQKKEPKSSGPGMQPFERSKNPHTGKPVWGQAQITSPAP